MTKHVCHITTVHPWGDVRIFHKQCKSLAKAGYKVTLLVANGPKGSKEIEGVEVIGIPVTYSSRVQRIQKAPKVLFKAALALDADSYHFHDPEFLKMGLKLKKRGKEVIYDVHEDVPRQILGKTWIGPGPLRKLISQVFERYENRIAKQLSAIVAATPFIRDRFLKVNRNTVDVNNFPKLEELGVPAPFAEKEPAICYVGGITVMRGIREMMQACESATFKIHLAGKFGTEALEQEIAAMPAWPLITNHGFVDREAVKAIYDRSMVGLVTLHPAINYLDALPVKMFEYMAAGIPVIASNFPLWQTIVDKNQCGITVDPLDPLAIRKGIEELLADPEKAARLGANGRAAVEQEYNWGQENIKLLKLYADLFSTSH